MTVLLDENPSIIVRKDYDLHYRYLYTIHTIPHYSHYSHYTHYTHYRGSDVSQPHRGKGKGKGEGGKNEATIADDTSTVCASQTASLDEDDNETVRTSMNPNTYRMLVHYAVAQNAIYQTLAEILLRSVALAVYALLLLYMPIHQDLYLYNTQSCTTIHPYTHTPIHPYTHTHIHT